MSHSIRVNDDLYEAARKAARAELRSIPQQIEYWARVGRAALDNPDLPADFVRELVQARAEARDSLARFEPGQGRAQDRRGPADD